MIVDLRCFPQHIDILPVHFYLVKSKQGSEQLVHETYIQMAPPTSLLKLLRRLYILLALRCLDPSI